jgi:aspartate-semialdehyde dehydrogenase
MAKKYTVAVVGACGVVGTEMISTLERRNFPVSELVPLDIASQAGKEVEFQGKNWVVKEAKKGAFEGVDIAIFSAGGSASEKLAPIAVEEGAIVVDNSSQWRMDPNCPLVVPEVNPQDLDWHKGIIANPNCSTIQMLVALKPLHEAAKIKRVVVSTYQAVSGSGKKAIDGLELEAEEMLKTGTVKEPKAYKEQIAFNCLPHIDVFEEGGYTKEEYKMVNETKKMLDKNIAVTATCVRVPVWYGHSESINIETEQKLTADQARELLSKAESIIVMDDPANEVYPTPVMSNNEDLTMVGRIREDYTIENGLNMWVVSNNIRKGAALNAVQVAETLIKRNLV